MDLRQNIAGKHVLIMEDIVDSGKDRFSVDCIGLTLKFLVELLKTRSCKSIQCCAFLMKTKCLKVDKDTLPLKFIGFEVDPIFVVGYGLDYAENYRTLPFVGELKEEVYKKK